MFRPPPRKVDGVEWMDRPSLPEAELWEDLANLEWLNRYGGGRRAVLRHLGRLVRRAGLARLHILDVGTGAGDIPRAIVEWARSRGLPVRVVAVERHPQILRYARAACAPYPEIFVEAADALALPFRPRSFDIALAGLLLHHLAPPDAVALLRRLDDLARHGVVVHDLVRSRRAYAGTWLAVRLLSRNRFTRTDGPLSVQRAYTVAELAALAKEAGLAGARIVRQAFFRAVLIHAQGGWPA